MIKKYFIIAAVIMLAAGCGKNTAILPAPSPTPTQSPSPTDQVDAFQKIADKFVSCQTYVNSTLGYSVACPANWLEYAINERVILFNSPKNMGLLRQVESGEMYGEGYQNDVTINYYESIADYPENASNNIQATTVPDLLSKMQTVSNVKEIKVGGVTAYGFSQGGLGVYYVVFIQHNGHLYEIFFGNKAGAEDLSAEEKDFLSSFKFAN